LKRFWKVFLSIGWVAVVFAFFFRQYADKVIEKLGM